MSKYGYLEVFQRVLKLRDNDSRLYFYFQEQLLTGKLRLDNELSRRMARGRLYIRVTSRSGETLRGIVQPRLSCNGKMITYLKF